MKKFTLQVFLFSSILVLFACAVNANPVYVQTIVLPGQDYDPINGWVEELGNQFDHINHLPFPDDEWITSGSNETLEHTCILGPDDPGIPNILVSITNNTGRCWTDLWYVADPETSLSNFDIERINGMKAFKIDKINNNRPLVYESMAQDSKFSPGETWSFIIDDYFNAQLPASALASLGVPSNGTNDGSSGSIIAIPEPCTIAVLAIGALALRRKK